MPRYYFHVADDRTTTDAEGLELPDLEAARKEAIRAASDALRDGPGPYLWSGKPWRMWVTDRRLPAGKTLFTLHFSLTQGDVTC